MQIINTNKTKNSIFNKTLDIVITGIKNVLQKIPGKYKYQIRKIYEYNFFEITVYRKTVYWKFFSYSTKIMEARLHINSNFYIDYISQSDFDIIEEDLKKLEKVWLKENIMGEYSEMFVNID